MHVKFSESFMLSDPNIIYLPQMIIQWFLDIIHEYYSVTNPRFPIHINKLIFLFFSLILLFIHINYKIMLSRFITRLATLPAAVPGKKLAYASAGATAAYLYAQQCKNDVLYFNKA
ncbi:hypothetical protein BCR42DRAFT_490834 [Absidia repens]|uniref:Uncharacterized protein n=1 Tax=Absidia repens TaxID=90262 RepID=A0A1X2IHM5_9FUNG|nr:hypothetical protein BCR42DRAFT_490834 [Absidia repens]